MNITDTNRMMRRQTKRGYFFEVGQQIFRFCFISDVRNRRAGRITFACYQIQRYAACFRKDRCVRFIHEIGDRFSEPVITAGIVVSLVHSLLHNCPGTACGKKKGMVV